MQSDNYFSPEWPFPDCFTGSLFSLCIHKTLIISAGIDGDTQCPWKTTVNKQTISIGIQEVITQEESLLAVEEPRTSYPKKR